MNASGFYITLSNPSAFRVLELHNGSRSDPLRGNLFQEATLNESHRYDALSYRWSEIDPESPSYIEIDGKQFPIGPGLHSALLQFRPKDYRRLLWIDQICINQADQADKFHQIKIMVDIYSKAQTVLIWLGDASEQTDIAMEFFPMFVYQVQREEGHWRSSLDQLSEPPADVMPCGGILAESLGSLLSRDWFGRIWTLQEAAMAQQAQIWCGQKYFSYEVMKTLQRGIANDTSGYWNNALRVIGPMYSSIDPENPDHPFNTHIAVMSTMEDTNEISSARIFNSLRNLDASEPQDRIYSVLRVLDQELVGEIARWQLSSPAQLYQHVAIQKLLCGELEYLGAAGISQQQSTFPEITVSQSRPRLALPSWVPDWTYIVQAQSYWLHNSERIQKRGEPLYTAGGISSRKFKCSVSDDKRKLCGKGVILDEISDCGAPFRSTRLARNLDNERDQVKTVVTHQKGLLSYVISCLELATKCSSRYGSANVEKHCRNSLIAGLTADSLGTTKTGVLKRASEEEVELLFGEFQKAMGNLEEMKLLTQRIRNGELLTSDDLNRMTECIAFSKRLESLLKKNNLIKAIGEACKGRRFVITRAKRYMGMAPDISQVGDKLCIIPGCCAPFAIRPIGNNCYQLLGEAYVAGVMDGEVLERADVCLEPIVFE